MSQPARPELVPTKEVADYLKVSTRQVNRWAQEGTIPRVKLGKRSSRFSLPAVLSALGVESEEGKEASNG